MQSDPETGQLEPLFNPRTQVWTDQSAWVSGGTHMIGVAPIGRATVTALRLNNENVVEARSIWIEFGWYPQKLRLKRGSVMTGAPVQWGVRAFGSMGGGT